MLASVLRRLAALAALLRLAACLPEDDAAVPSDVKYIRCGVCQQLITAVHEQVTAARKKSKAKKLSEESIQTIIESACKPSTEAGSWLKFLDMAETDGGGIQVEPSPPLQRSPHLSTSTSTCASTTASASHLHLHLHLHLHQCLHLPPPSPPPCVQVERQAEDGPCGRECKTLGMACEQLMEEGWEDSLSESLFSGEAADDLRETACREWSSACRKAPPKLDPSRRPGPPFRPFTEDERALEAYRTGAPAAPGVFQDDALRYALGIGPKGDADDGAFAGEIDFDGGGYGSPHPGVGGERPLHEDLARMDAFISSDEM